MMLEEEALEDASATNDEPDISPPPTKRRKTGMSTVPQLRSSPIRLTRVRDLPDNDNIDTVTLSQILGDPLIAECWQFNFLFDLDYVMQHFDHDVRKLVKVKIVHGSWRSEDRNRLQLEEALQRWPNVVQVKAWLEDPFGCHHSKMMILFRHDEMAQVIIHTANMIPQDWTNFTQAVWQSPRLQPLQDMDDCDPERGKHAVGTGQHFKADLLQYLRSYGTQRTGELVDRLLLHDFGEVRAALIASSPGKVPISEAKTQGKAQWGWPGMQSILSKVPITSCHEDDTSLRPLVVAQVSSIATLGAGNKWLTEFMSVLACSSSATKQKPNFKVVFPAVSEVQDSLDGYQAGASIHLRVQNKAQINQLELMRPFLCHWGHQLGAKDQKSDIRDAGRSRAAPHIKTYTRFTDSRMQSIDWVLLTSANLSRQAWGTSVIDGHVKISSYEIGVLLWPELYAGASNSKVMFRPAFKQDRPIITAGADAGSSKTVVGIRMPYSLPLVEYAAREMPWSPAGEYHEPDRFGRVWMGR